jgi:hypothetical protein
MKDDMTMFTWVGGPHDGEVAMLPSGRDHIRVPVEFDREHWIKNVDPALGVPTWQVIDVSIERCMCGCGGFMAYWLEEDSDG